MTSGDWNWVIFVQSSIHTARPSLSLQSHEKLPIDSLQGHSLQARSFLSLIHAFTPAAPPIGLSRSEGNERR